MERIETWEQIKNRLISINEIIFKEYDYDKLSNYEKRKIIFNYLAENMSYDYIGLMDICLKDYDLDTMTKQEKEILFESLCNKLPLNEFHQMYLKKKIMNNDVDPSRDSFMELYSSITDHVGLCNGIAEYYKLLLELNGIYSVCVIVDNMMPCGHQINMTYNDETDTYSFDDVTSAVCEIGDPEDCFDYDIEMAEKLNQGIRSVYALFKHLPVPVPEEKTFGFIFGTQMVNFFVNKKDDSYLRYGLETNGNTKLPSNISSIKKQERTL